MDIETITKLLDAGYTKQEIDAMQGANGAGDQVDESAGKETETAGNDQSNAGAENADEIDATSAIKSLTDTVAGLAATVKAMQDDNAKGAQTRSAKPTDEVKAVMDSFIEKL